MSCQARTASTRAGFARAAGPLVVLAMSFTFRDADAQEEGAAPLKPRERPWTLFVYGAADNNADGPMLYFLDQVRKALADEKGMELVLFVDRHTGYSNDATLLGEDFTGARLYKLGATKAERLDGGAEFPEITLESEWESDSADPETLRKFLVWGKKRFPARRYGLLIYGHADGIGMCPDEQTNREMGIAEMTDVVKQTESVDFTALELCNMGGVEIAYQWRPGNGGFETDVLVAIPNAGPPLDWDRAFARIKSPNHPKAKEREDCLDPATMTAADFGRLVIEEGRLGRIAAAEANPERAERVAHEAAAAYDLVAVEEVKSAVDAFAVELASGGTESKQLLESLRGPGDRGTVMNYCEGEFRQSRPFVDLYDLLQRAATCEELAPAARDAAARAQQATDDFVLASFGMKGYAGFSQGQHGVFIVFPDGDAPNPRVQIGRSHVWRLVEWYVPFEFRREKTSLGNWAWCRDGATVGDGVVQNWFELLDSWFDRDNDEQGGENGCRF